MLIGALSEANDNVQPSRDSAEPRYLDKLSSEGLWLLPIALDRWIIRLTLLKEKCHDRPEPWWSAQRKSVLQLIPRPYRVSRKFRANFYECRRPPDGRHCSAVRWLRLDDENEGIWWLILYSWVYAVTNRASSQVSCSCQRPTLNINAFYTLGVFRGRSTLHQRMNPRINDNHKHLGILPSTREPKALDRPGVGGPSSIPRSALNKFSKYNNLWVTII